MTYIFSNSPLILSAKDILSSPSLIYVVVKHWEADVSKPEHIKAKLSAWPTTEGKEYIPYAACNSVPLVLEDLDFCTTKLGPLLEKKNLEILRTNLNF